MMNTMISFADLTKQVHLINDLIMSDMMCSNEDGIEQTLAFSRHVLSTKYWFLRISFANKKRYLLALLEDITSAWTLSLLLKSMWNCRPKDAVLSVYETETFSSFDQAPMDHNRAAVPVYTLAQVMTYERKWFLTLDPESQAIVLSEMLTVAGGPIMWEVLRRAQRIYDKYRNYQLKNILECTVVTEPPPEKVQSPPSPPEKPKDVKKDQSMSKRKISTAPTISEVNMKQVQPGQAQKELDANLAVWNATIKAMRDSFKLEEFEMIFNDGTKQKIWKVNRPKPEGIETVDFLQLLPSSISKRIISYLPRAQLGDYARVNKYWAFLVDEFRAELNARVKINAELEKLREVMLNHDTSLDVIAQTCSDFQMGLASSQTGHSVKVKRLLPSMRQSMRSAGGYSFRHFLTEKLTKPPVKIVPKPLRNLSELTEHLNRRGAADENLWQWCENLVKQQKKISDEDSEDRREGVFQLDVYHFPCPMMKEELSIPLKSPLYNDPTIASSRKQKKNISNANLLHAPKYNIKRYSLWSRDFSSLYRVFKIPSYQSPV